MKRIFAGVALFAVVFALGASLSLGADPSAVQKALDAKHLGDWVKAADYHPKDLCKAEYLWHAAAELVGHKNKAGNYVYDDKKATEAAKTQALEYLKQARAFIGSSHNQEEENQGCKGVDEDDLTERIDLVEACCQGHCK